MRGSQHNLFVLRPYPEAFKKTVSVIGVLSYRIVCKSRLNRLSTSLNNFLNLIN